MGPRTALDFLTHIRRLRPQFEFGAIEQHGGFQLPREITKFATVYDKFSWHDGPLFPASQATIAK